MEAPKLKSSGILSLAPQMSCRTPPTLSAERLFSPPDVWVRRSDQASREIYLAIASSSTRSHHAVQVQSSADVEGVEDQSIVFNDLELVAMPLERQGGKYVSNASNALVSPYSEHNIEKQHTVSNQL